MTDAHLEAVIVEPPSEATAAVIWLHGLGADGHDFAPVVPMVGLPELGARVVLPHAPSLPVSINGGFVMPAWYDIRDGDLKDRHDEAGIRRSAEQVEALITREKERGLPASRIVVIGFSQGGAMALHVGLRHPERLAGIGALSTYLVLEETLDAERHAANQTTPIFQAHGRHDAVVAYERGAAARDWLRAQGYRVSFSDYPMQHEVHPQELLALRRWFAEVL
jgi:phospholipase/carboxylesterase